MNSVMNIKDGEFTSAVYSLIKEQKFAEAIRILLYQHEIDKTNQAALSLLGYCYYYIQDHNSAAIYYNQLQKHYPHKTEYKLYYAQALVYAFRTQEALSVIATIDDEALLPECIKLEATIKYQEEDMANCRILIDQLDENDPDIDVNLACVDYKEKNYDAALEKFEKASQYSGYQPDLAYSIALCHYQKKDYDRATKFLNDIIERGIKEHPEFAIGAKSMGLDVINIHNTLRLHESNLIEAFNLKFAIYFKIKDNKRAMFSLQDMPPRNESELDPITLHNQALIAEDVSESFEKLQFLMNQHPYPPETFANLMFLYIQHEEYDVAADFMAENAHLTYKLLTTYQYDYLEAMLNVKTSTQDAILKLERMQNEQLKVIRRIGKEISDRNDVAGPDDEMLKHLVEKYEKHVDELYIPPLMAHAKIYWTKKNYSAIEKILRNSMEFCKDNDTWKLNAAHNIFMQEHKYKEACGFYESIVRKQYDNILGISAIILANLCVCYIMTNQNEEAEELLKKIETEEENFQMENPTSKLYHNSIANLVIGCLYCSKGNFEFGLTRVYKALEPLDRRLSLDTWYYAKRCIMAVLDSLARHMVAVRDQTVKELFMFLRKCESAGRNIYTVSEAILAEAPDLKATVSVTYEARMLRATLTTIFNS